MNNSNGFRSNRSNVVIDTRRERYHRGCRVELASMDEPYIKLKPGDRGTVEFVTDEGGLFVNFDCGLSRVIYRENQLKKLPQMPFTDNYNEAEKLKKSICDCIDWFYELLFGSDDEHHYLSDRNLPRGTDIEVCLRIKTR